MIQELQALLGLPGIIVAVVVAFAIGGCFVYVVRAAHEHKRWCEARDERWDEDMAHVRKRLDEGSSRFTEISDRLSRIEGKLEGKP